MVPNYKSEAEVRAVLVICLVFLQETSKPAGSADRAAEYCANLLASDRATLQPVARRIEASLSEPGKWSLLLDSVSVLRRELAEDSLHEILELLMNLSLSDGRYEHAEDRFMTGLRNLWDIHGSDSNEEPIAWSILDPSDAHGQGNWSSIHELAVLYFGLAHRTDQMLAPEEVQAIVRKIGEWLPDSIPADINRIVSEAMIAYSEGDHEGMIEKAVADLQRAVPVHQRRAVLNDLMFIARADKVVLVEEKEMIARLAIAWDIDPSSID